MRYISSFKLVVFVKIVDKFYSLLDSHHPPEAIRCNDQKLVDTRRYLVHSDVRDWGDYEFTPIVVETPQIAYTSKQRNENCTVSFLEAPFIWRKVVPGKRVTLLPELPWASQLFSTFPYKTLRTVCMRNKKLARLEG